VTPSALINRDDNRGHLPLTMGYLLALIALRRWEDVKGVSQKVSQNGQLLSRRGRSLPASASGLDTHRDPISMPF
jgi:hypothetical protein